MAGRKGQSLAEYTLILVFVALACIAAVTLFGGTVCGFYDGFKGSF
jgi:Flp pilus assembly pilin Flp